MLRFTHPTNEAIDRTAACGRLPEFLDATDPRPASEQINERYQFGGGWEPMEGWTQGVDLSLCYPEDPPLAPVAKARLRDETIVLYRHSFVAIVQKSGDFEVARID